MKLYRKYTAGINLFFVSAALLTLSVLAWTQPQNSDPEHSAYRAVYRITNSEGTSGGTGWRLSSGYLITNDHVCAIAQNNKIFVKDSQGRAGISTIIATDKDRDLCLLSPQPNTYSLNIAPVRAEHFQAIYVVGHPYLEDARFEKGIYIADTVGTFGDNAKEDGTCEDGGDPVNTLFGSYCIRHMILSETNARTFPGNSGSPVLNESGNVVGVINSGNPNTNNGAYVPYEALRSFLIENHQKVN